MTILESTTERVEDALRRLAVEAADLFEELLAAGAELPFDLEPSDAGPLPMYSYAPLTGEFIHRHAAELRRLEAFVEVGELVSEETAIGFLVGLWEGRSEFEIAGDRLRGAIDGVIASLGATGAGATPTGEVIVPLIGFHMPAEEIELDGVRIVSASSVTDAPVEASEAAGKGFLAVVSCGFAEVAPAAAVADELRRALRTMRLFRPGAVGIGAHGWARRNGGWERFSTGAGRPRHGGYRLTGSEAAELEQFAHSLTERGARVPALAWAISRFDLGAERASLIDALSDYLLALRGLLEGGGAIKAGLGARVAALACEPEEREGARLCVERALTIERKLMSGARYRPSADASPLDVIAELEELLRRILKGLAMGELSGDLRAAADEILLAEGLTVAATAQPQAGETAEWRLPDPTPDEEELDLGAAADDARARGGARGRDRATREVGRDVPGEIEVRRAEPETSEAVQSPPGEVGQGPPIEQTTTRIVVTDVELPEIMGADNEHPRPLANSEPEPEARGNSGPSGESDWFSAAEGELEWPAFARPRRDRGDAERRPREPSDRVRHLFPVPDATDWEVGELRYERKRPG